MSVRSVLKRSVIAVFALSAFSLFGEPADSAHEYRMLVPVLSVKCSSVEKFSSSLADGLIGCGFNVSSERIRQFIAESVLLPDVGCLDHSKPLSLFYLSRTDGEGATDCAALLPLSLTGNENLQKTMTEKYGVVNGKSTKICRAPVDEMLPEVVYFAVAEGNILISSSLNGLRWLAVNQRDKSLPTVDLPENFSIKLVFNGPLSGQKLRTFAESFTNDVSNEISLNNLPMNIRELASVFDNFSSVSASLNSSLEGLSISFRLDSPRYSDFDTSLRKLKAPGGDLASFTPDFAENISFSSALGIIAALPKHTRHWLSFLSLDLWFAGLSVFPALPEFDDEIYKFLSGQSVSMFVADRSTLKLGHVAFYTLSNATACSKTIGKLFSNGGIVKSSNIKYIGVREVKSVPVYQYDIDFGNRVVSSSGNGGETLSAATEMTRVEIAVWKDKLVVANGHRELIDFWLNGDVESVPLRTLSVDKSSHSSVEKDYEALGGGFIKPVETLRLLFNYIDSFRSLVAKMPLSGSGFQWTLSRNGSSAVIDIHLAGNEILACGSLGEVKSNVMLRLLSNFLSNPVNKEAADQFMRKRKQKSDSISGN